MLRAVPGRYLLRILALVDWSIRILIRRLNADFEITNLLFDGPGITPSHLSLEASLLSLLD
jgi:hypothetical protein